MIAAIVAGAAACGGSTDGANEKRSNGFADGGDGGGRSDAAFDSREPGPDAGGPPLTCTGDGFSLNAISVTPAFDYVELRVEDGYNAAAKDEVTAKLGVLCANATDAAACKTKLEAIEQPVKLTCSVPYPCSARYLVYTRGDEVATILPNADLAKTAAPIDSIEEAVAVLGWNRSFACADASYRATGDGFDIAYSSTRSNCPSNTDEIRSDVLVHVSRDGTITVIESKETIIPGNPNTGCAVARRALDVAYTIPSHVHDAADWISTAAHLEAASVGSFARLARELARLGAPADLVQRATEAARDERRHARVLRKIARAAGRHVPRSPHVPSAPRSIEIIAAENAVEGTARETWGAVIAAYQARFAPAPLRSAFEGIARDEAEHASLASDVARWLEDQLDDVQRARVAELRARALVDLEREIRSTLPPPLRRELGLPSADVAASMFAAARELFAA